MLVAFNENDLTRKAVDKYSERLGPVVRGDLARDGKFIRHYFYRVAYGYNSGYTWHPNGHEVQGVFQIVLRIPSRRIAWRSMSDGLMSGVVSFEPRSDQETEITLKIRSIFDPPGLSRRVEEYLGNFQTVG